MKGKSDSVNMIVQDGLRTPNKRKLGQSFETR